MLLTTFPLLANTGSDQLDTDKIAGWIATCKHDNGGYSAAPQLDQHLRYTLSAIQILTTLDAMTPEIKVRGTLEPAQLQQRWAGWWR